MAQAPELLTQLVRAAFGNGGKPKEAAHAPGRDDAPMEEAAAEPSSLPAPREGETDENGFDAGIVGVLAEKVLLSWLSNRHQLLFPFALDLRNLDSKQAELLVHAMIAAAQADGAFDGKERQRIEGTLNRIDPSEDEKAFLASAIGSPKPLHEILTQVRDVQTGALVYAASLMAVDQRKPVNNYYLKYLAARLQLSEDLVASLEQRYRSSS